ncbi:MAG: low-specificity L-threonine aldolase [Syntrophobacterales bacterium]|nr:MAG: low-specificity L-threonine aldolase [Syntrophobacterales bacterium]
MERIIDLRSDTVTKPTDGMREAMKDAEVGDDVFGEDPTVNALQEKVARLLNKEAAIFVCSGTMANQVAIRAHTQHGDEVIIESESHTFNYEGGGGAALSGVQYHPIKGDRGVLDPAQIEDAIRPHDHHFAPTRLICLENTHNRAGGRIYPIEKIRGAHHIAKRNGLAMHLDGARLLNASTASGIPPDRYARYFDSVSICLSKGLGAPIGSVTAGSREFIDRVHRFRKMFGGGMRQVGIIAAAGIYALDHHADRLGLDHANAKRLAQGLSQIDGVQIDLNIVETNIVVFDVSEMGIDPHHIAESLKERRILMIPFGKALIRAVTHLDVSAEDIERSIEIAADVFSSLKRRPGTNSPSRKMS